MLNNIKSGLIVLGLFLMVGVTALTFGFKADVKNSPILADQWYVINIEGDDPEETSDQEIVTTSGTPTESGCNEINNGTPCAVHLSFTGAAPSIPANTTVEDAVNSYGATVLGYARQPL